ncbi:MAG: TonB-dependent receptor, partial [Myxococcales bacterium]|nr:TonB-dependent receptor [Myxococcales bacterium]
MAVAPAPGATTTMRKTTRNVQHLRLEVFEEAKGPGVHHVLDSRLGSVVLNDVQNNPLQPDLQYRGFTASPLLGSPQGVAVYQNGARLNEPFGDVMQWDLMPEFAIREVQVMPGASPLYGLNALGGSLSLRMKDGFRNAGHRVEALGGSFGRHQVSAEVGQSVAEDWALFAGVSSFGEQGFRDESPSRALHGFADLRHRTPQHELGASLTLARSDLNGNGLAPVELLESDGRDAVFTFPDNTQNDLVMVSADLDRELSATLSVQATAYLRSLRRDTLNGDEGEFELCTEHMQSFVCEEGGELVRSETGDNIASMNEHDGLFNTTQTSSAGYGGSLQVTHEDALWSGDNQLIAGASYDGGHVDFLQRAELGLLTSDRSVIGQNFFLGGDEFRTKLRSNSRMLGVYASDTFSPVEELAINLAARLNWVNVELDDREGSALDGDHSFTRVNPAVG